MVKEPGGPRYMSKLEAGITQLVNKAAGGDLKAIREAIQWIKEFEDQAPLLPPPVLHVHFSKGKAEKPVPNDDSENRPGKDDAQTKPRKVH